MRPDPAVAIKDLRIALPRGGERAYAVDGVSFDLNPGEIVCVVGEIRLGQVDVRARADGAVAGQRHR